MPHAIVVGASLAGLSAAFSLSLRGFDVTLIDKREAYTLKQRIFMPQDLVKKFYNLTDLAQKGINLDYEHGFPHLIYAENINNIEKSGLDFTFFSLLEECKGVIEIKALQEYQLSKFKNLQQGNKEFNYLETTLDPEALTSVELQRKIAKSFVDKIAFLPKAMPVSMLASCIAESLNASGLSDLRKTTKRELQLKGKVDFLMGPQYEIIHIDANEQELTLQDHSGRRKLSFDHLVCADGAKHEMASLIEAHNPKYKFPVRLLESPKHNAYGMARFSISNKYNLLDQLKYEIISPPTHTWVDPQLTRAALANFGWHEEYLPLIYIAIDKVTRECYVTGEVPKELNHVRAALADNWFKDIISYITLIAREHFVCQEESIFQVRTSAFAKSHMTLGQKGKLFLVGDAFIPANFLYGHGAHSAIKDGNFLYQCFDNKQNLLSTEALDEWSQLRFEEYEYYKRLIEDVRSDQEKSNISKMKVEKFKENPVEHILDTLTSRSSITNYSVSLYARSMLQSQQDFSWMRAMVNTQKQIDTNEEFKKNKNSFALTIYKPK